MKPIHFAILLIVLILGIVNLLTGLGVIGGAGKASADNWEYRVMTPQEMDSVGFKAVAAEIGAKEDAEGKMQLPQAKVVKNALLQTSLNELKKEGWDAVSVTSDSLYIFRRAK